MDSQPDSPIKREVAAEHLEVPLRERNQLLLAAGYAPRYPQTPIDSPDLSDVKKSLLRLLDAHEAIITGVRDAIERTARNGDAGSNDLLMSDVLRTHETQVWFLAEHLVDTPLVHAELPTAG